MSSRIWSREDIRNVLVAIYAAKLRPENGPIEEGDADDEARLYWWGCRAAVQSLMLAFGLPLQLLDQAVQQPAPSPAQSGTATEDWWIEDLENIIAAVYRSAVSTPLHDAGSPAAACYRRGFEEVITLLLQAIGSPQNTHRWFKQVRADRYWVFVPDRDDSVKTIGSPQDGPATD